MSVALDFELHQLTFSIESPSQCLPRDQEAKKWAMAIHLAQMNGWNKGEIFDMEILPVIPKPRKTRSVLRRLSDAINLQERAPSSRRTRMLVGIHSCVTEGRAFARRDP